MFVKDWKKLFFTFLTDLYKITKTAIPSTKMLKNRTFLNILQMYHKFICIILIHIYYLRLIVSESMLVLGSGPVVEEAADEFAL